MLTQYFFQNLQFTVSVLGILVFILLSFLHFDAWKIDKNGTANLLTKGLGFLSLSFYYALQASQTTFYLSEQISHYSLFLGLMLVFFSLFSEKTPSIPKGKNAASGVIPSIAPLIINLTTLSAGLHFLIAIQYFIKIKKGLHRELKPLFIGFLLLSVSQFLIATFYLSNNANIFISELFSLYGPVWIVTQCIQVLGLLVISLWIFGYIRFRLNVELFAIAITSFFIIFIATTFVFTFLLLRNLQESALGHLNTDSRILQYSLERLQTDALENSKKTAVDAIVLQSLDDNDVESLFKRASELMIAQGSDVLIITDNEGRIIVRADDQDKSGESMTDNQLVMAALSKNARSTIQQTQDPYSERVQVQGGAPIIVDDVVIGAVLSGFVIDDAFVDNFKTTTGLDVTLYTNDRKATTTLLSPDGKTRLVGTKESDQQILSTVLKNKKTFLGTTSVINEPYYAAFKPLVTSDNKIVGMIFTGKPESDIIKTAKDSFKLTFVGTLIMMLMSIIPAFFVSRYIAENLQA